MKYLFASLVICLSLSVHAQQHHFLYIQADNRQPFFVKLDKKILSSSASGYLIIPQLLDSSYELSIGFPKNEWPEQKVTCSIDKKDIGYLLKNFGEKGWGLFNFQTMDLVMAETRTNADSTKATVNTDAFSNALANVVNDPAIKVVEEPKENSATATVPVKKTAAKKIVKAPVKNKSKDLALNKNKDRISKLVSRRNADGLKMVYVDKVNGVADTVNVVIPIEKPVAKTVAAKVDTVAIAEKKAVAKHIASNKKPAKKPAAKVDLAKLDKKTADQSKDSAAVISPEIKTEEPKTDIVQENKNPITDTAVVVQPPKKLEDIIADIAKNNVNSPEPIKDTVKTIQPEVKPEEIKPDIAVTKKNEEPVLDTVAKKPAEISVDIPKEDNKTITPPVDSTLNTTQINVEQAKPEPAKETVEEPVSQRIDSIATTNVDKPDVKKDQTNIPDKRANEAIVVEKPKEDIIPKTNSAPSAPTYACKYVADGDEFMSLRKKMLKGKSDNEMLFIAHQLFLKRCVTTKQVERLSVLFNNDLAKYNLFDDAYHFIADPDIFPSLESQLTDQYYIKRFRAMLRQ